MRGLVRWLKSSKVDTLVELGAGADPGLAFELAASATGRRVGSVVAAFRHLLAAEVVRRWLAAAVLGQMAWCMAPMALLAAGVTLLESVSTGARLAGLVTLATAFGAPLWGRWMDAHGIVLGLCRAGWISAVGAVLLAAALLGRASTPLLGLLAVVLGAALAPMPAAFRAMLPSLVRTEQLPTASHLEAVALEVALIGGPGLTSGVLLLWDQGAAAVLGWVACLAAAAAVVLRRLPLRPPSPRDGQGSPAPPRSTAPDLLPGPAARPGRSTGWHRVGRHPVAAGIVAAALMLGISGGLLETAVFAQVAEVGATTAAAAGLLTLMGVGSAIGGGLAALRPPPVSAWAGGMLLALHGAGILLAAGAGPLWLVAAYLFAAGAPVAPVNSVGALALERRVPGERQSTSFTVAAAALTLGAGSGQLLGGLTIDLAGPQGTFLTAALLPIVLGLALLTRGHRRGPGSAR